MEKIKDYRLYYNNIYIIEYNKTGFKGFIINDIKINLELFKLLINTKNEYLNYEDKTNISDKCIILNNNDEIQKKYINKILTCSKFFNIKNIYLFDIYCINRDKNKNITKYSIIKNIRHKTLYNVNFDKEKVNEVLHNINLYCLRGSKNWKNNLTNDFFDFYSKKLESLFNITISDITNKLDNLKIQDKVFEKIIIID